MKQKVSGWSFFLLLLPICRAVLVNRTIDDTFGDSVTGFKPVYLPPGTWTDQTCTGCAVQPDTKSAYEGTWTAANYSPGMNNMSITLEFKGVAIWVFFILTNANDHDSDIVTNTQCNFTLDGQHAGYFTHLPDMSASEMEYNVTSFSRSGLTNAPHQLVISTSDYPFNTFVGFDYAIYTADVDESSMKTALFDPSISPSSPQRVLLAARSESSPQDVGVIVGSVLGGLGLFVILVTLYLIWRLSQQKRPNYRPVQNGTDRPAQDPRRGHFAATQATWRNNSSEQLGVGGSLPRMGTLHVDTGSHSHSRSHSSDNLGSGSSLSANRRNQEHLSPPGTSNQEKLRIMRQREINDRLQLAQREMGNLTSRQVSPSEGSSSSAGQEMASLREQVQELRDQIETLHTQRNSPWAQGLTDEQPPAYMG